MSSNAWKVWTVVAGLLTAVIVSCAPQQAKAEIKMTSVGVHVGSWHSNNEDGHWNNRNPGVFVTANYSGNSKYLDGEYILGTYYNSQRNQSVYFGRQFQLFPYVGVTVGLVTGYDWATVSPMVAPTLQIPITKSIIGNITVLPKVSSSGAWVIHSSFQYRF